LNIGSTNGLRVQIHNVLLNSTSEDAGPIFRGDKVETHRKLVIRCITEWNLFHSNPYLLKNSININCLRQTE
jgi:hypothetical protein